MDSMACFSEVRSIRPALEFLTADDPPLPGTGYAVASADDTDGKEEACKAEKVYILHPCYLLNSRLNFFSANCHRQSSRGPSKCETVSSVSSPMLEKRTFRL